MATRRSEQTVLTGKVTDGMEMTANGQNVWHVPDRLRIEDGPGPVRDSV
jgi:hypothetical protein